jgi:uncharacterized protein
MIGIARLAAVSAVSLGMATADAAQDREGWPADLTIGTATQGGTYFVYGNGLAGFIGERLGLNASGEVTGGPVQNATLVETGDHLMGLVTMGPAREAWAGESELAPGLPHRRLRALFPMYQTQFQVVALADSGIRSVADLEGKRVSVGPAGGTAGTYWPRFLETLGVEAEVSYAGAADAAGQLEDGLIDAFAFAAGLPIPAFGQLAVENDVAMFGFTPEEQEAIVAEHPVVAYTIPAGLYDGHDTEQPTVSMWNFAVANADMPDSLAYEITRLVLENNDRMRQIHAAAEETVTENWDRNTFLPYHPGAIRYYEEQGIEIPEELRP